MSDVQLQAILEEMKGLRADLKKGVPSATRTTTTAASTKTEAPKTDANAIASDPTLSAADKKKAADKAIADAKAKKQAETSKGATTDAKPGGAAKAPGGKHNIDQVREMIRKVAADIDKQTAKDILKDDGGGVEKVLDLKPEFYDAVFEACEVVLKGEGDEKTAAVSDEDDLM